MSKLTKGYGSTGIQEILGAIKTYFEGKLAQKANTSDIPVITGKADKVSNATAGNLAGLDASGNLTDSGYTVDSTPTANSGNPVSSGGVYTALTNKTDNTIVSDIESTTTASKAYAVDEYLMLNNILYKVTSAISSGGTIVTSGASANVVAVKITDEIGQGGGGADLTILAPEFNTTTSYGVGDYVTYDGSLYRFTSAHSAGAWNSAQVTEIKAVGQYVTAGKKSGTTLGDCATAEGNSTEASGKNSHAEGYFTKARGNNSHAEGDHTIASGYSSHAEGNMTTASGAYSHAEGDHTIANTDSSHAEGNMTTASGAYSHAEGEYTVASGRCSHAEGRSTASGAYSHAEGYATKAQRKSQTAIGEYNVADTTGADGTVRGDYAFIIGNGTGENARSNALTVDWDGNLEVAGKISASNIHGEWTLAGSTGGTAGHTDSTLISLSDLQNKELLIVFSIEREDSDSWDFVKALYYPFSSMILSRIANEDNTVLWRGFCSNYPTSDTFSKDDLSTIFASKDIMNVNAIIGATCSTKLYDWHLEIYTR